MLLRRFTVSRALAVERTHLVIRNQTTVCVCARGFFRAPEQRDMYHIIELKRKIKTKREQKLMESAGRRQEGKEGGRGGRGIREEKEL